MVRVWLEFSVTALRQVRLGRHGEKLLTFMPAML